MSLYRIPIYHVRLVRHKRHQVASPLVTSPQVAAQVLRSYLKGADREHVVVILLDARQAIIGINTVSIGTLTAALVHPRELWKPAILASAAGIIMGHNHISGDPTPSTDDRSTAKRTIEAGKLLGIPVVDWLILGDHGRYFSARERGEVS